MNQHTDDNFARTILARALGAPAPPAALDIERAIQGGRSRRARKRTFALGGAAAALGVAVAVALAPRLMDHPTRTVIPASAAATSVALPTSNWPAPDGTSSAMLAELSGSLTQRGTCLLVGDLLVIWPRGTTGRLAEDGRIDVLSSDGTVIARTGQHLHLTGGSIPDRVITVPECAGYTETFDAQRIDAWGSWTGSPSRLGASP
ncbi:MAG: hypothetical protein IPK24_17855 [Kineosporiaceae bacterium]|nr:hypothetical protein [Kineosporiaceae bacterium]